MDEKIIQESEGKLNQPKDKQTQAEQHQSEQLRSEQNLVEKFQPKHIKEEEFQSEQHIPVQTNVSTEKMSREEKHLEKILRQIEEAKDPTMYDTYQYLASGAEDPIKVFLARKKGIMHIQKGIPCQDYCDSAFVNGCKVLTCADGVSSCEHSDVGSKLACDAVVNAFKQASKSYSDEEQLVNRLLSVSFRERLVSSWINLVMEKVKETNPETNEDTVKEFSKYGSTIMFAIFTSNWIVVGNLGDGQILLFNDEYGVKLRMHDPKLSSAVRCLANERCAREDFIVEKYPRQAFQGVLLSTDGMYECLDRGEHFYEYARQMKGRFLEKQAPYQAFCYQESGEPYKDFWAMRTQDDCSIVLALCDTTMVSNDFSIRESVASHSKAAVFRRFSEFCVSYLVKDMEDSLADIIISDGDFAKELEILSTASIDSWLEEWEDSSFHFSKYPISHAKSLELMHSSGQLRRDRHNTRASDKRVLNVFYAVKCLKEELEALGYRLNASAAFNILYDGKELHIRREAIEKKKEENVQVLPRNLENYFSHILGVLKSEHIELPVYDIGYVDRGVFYYRQHGNSNEKLAQLIRDKKELRLKNISSYVWKLEDETELEPNESVALEAEFSFIVLNQQGEAMEQFRYTSKERL